MMVQWAKGPNPKPDLSSIFGTQMVGKELIPKNCPLICIHMLWHTQTQNTHKCMHTQSKYITM